MTAVNSVDQLQSVLNGKKSNAAIATDLKTSLTLVSTTTYSEKVSCYKRVTSQEKKRVLKSETLNLFQNFDFTFLSLQFKFRVYTCIVLCCLIAFLPHSSAYFLTSGYLLQTPDNSNFFRFPLKVRVIGSRLYNYSVQLCYDAETREIGLLRFHEASPTQHRVDILGIIWHLCLKWKDLT